MRFLFAALTIFATGIATGIATDAAQAGASYNCVRVVVDQTSLGENVYETQCDSAESEPAQANEAAPVENQN